MFWKYAANLLENIHAQVCNFIEITLRHGFFPVNLLHISRTPFYQNNYGRLLLKTLQRLYYLSISCQCSEYNIFNVFRAPLILPAKSKIWDTRKILVILYEANMWWIAYHQRTKFLLSVNLSFINGKKSYISIFN